MWGLDFTMVYQCDSNVHNNNYSKSPKKVLKHDEVEVFNCDAKAFEGYGDYNIFYFCNPFDETVFSVVAQKIIETHGEGISVEFIISILISRNDKRR